jgi:hypothetical protein
MARRRALTKKFSRRKISRRVLLASEILLFPILNGPNSYCPHVEMTMVTPITALTMAVKA